MFLLSHGLPLILFSLVLEVFGRMLSNILSFTFVMVNLKIYLLLGIYWRHV